MNDYGNTGENSDGSGDGSSGGFFDFLGSLVGSATNIYTARTQEEIARTKANAANAAAARAAAGTGNNSKLLLIGGGVLALVLVLVLAFRK